MVTPFPSVCSCVKVVVVARVTYVVASYAYMKVIIPPVVELHKFN